MAKGIQITFDPVGVTYDVYTSTLSEGPYVLYQSNVNGSNVIISGTPITGDVVYVKLICDGCHDQYFTVPLILPPTATPTNTPTPSPSPSSTPTPTPTSTTVPPTPTPTPTPSSTVPPPTPTPTSTTVPPTPTSTTVPPTPTSTTVPPTPTSTTVPPTSTPTPTPSYYTYYISTTQVDGPTACGVPATTPIYSNNPNLLNAKNYYTDTSLTTHFTAMGYYSIDSSSNPSPSYWTYIDVAGYGLALTSC